MPRFRRSLLLAPVAVLLAAAPAHAISIGGVTNAVTQTAENTASSTPLAPVVGQVTQPLAPVVNTGEQVTQPVTQPLAPVTQPVEQVVQPVTGTAGQVVQTVTGTLDTATGGAVGGAVGAVGGLLTGGGAAVDKAIQQALTGVPGVPGAPGAETGSGAASGALPQVTVVRLLSLLGAPANAAGASSDGRAPKVVVTALSRLSRTGKTGKVKLRVTSSEPSVVVLGGTIRPGKARKGKTNSRKPIHFRAVTLAFRKAGALEVTIVLSRTAQRHLGAARNGRLSVQTLAVDLARNQARDAVKRSLKR